MKPTIVPATPDLPADEIALLLWSTDPALWSFLFPEPELLQRVLAVEWPAPVALLSHAFTTVAFVEDDLVAICTGYAPDDLQTAHEATLQLQPGALDAVAAAHLRRGLFWMNRLFPDPRPDAFHIMELAVHTTVQGQGLAGALLSDAENRARAAGYAWISLDVAADNDAVGFYRHLGFAVEIETRIPLLAEKGVGTHLHMARALS